MTQQTRILERLANTIDASLRLHRVPARVTGGNADVYQRIVFDVALDGADGIARELRKMTGADGCVIRLQVGLTPPMGGWR